MKKISTLAFVLLSFLLSHSQVRMAILGGLQSSSVIEKNNQPGWTTSFGNYYSNRASVHAGILMEIPIEPTGKWFFRPGILYSGKGRKYSKVYDSATAAQSDTSYLMHNFFTNYIEFPLNLAYKLPLRGNTKLLITGGPYLSLFYNGKQKFESRSFSSNNFTSDEYKMEVGKDINKVKTLDLGVNIRAGFDFGNVFLTAFFSQGLSNFYTASYDGTFKHRVIGASVGFWLSKAAAFVKKPKDKDKDGVYDDADACPELAGPPLTNGCPDKDNDGVADKDDNCPELAGLAKYKGCPVPDSDKDGINDEEDKCPNKAGVAKYGGCPVPDTDGDGLNDEVDACPDKPGVIEYNGCPIPDSDGDGVNDKEDKCITEPGTKENNGCPEIKNEIVEKVNFVAQNILFDVNSDKLSLQSFGPLNQVAEILKNNPSFMLSIGGHSDNTGDVGFNLRLSQKRADAVKAYLVKQGIAASRLQAKGFGSSQPLDETNTATGKAKNRRVELRLNQ